MFFGVLPIFGVFVLVRFRALLVSVPCRPLVFFFGLGDRVFASFVVIKGHGSFDVVGAGSLADSSGLG